MRSLASSLLVLVFVFIFDRVDAGRPGASIRAYTVFDRDQADFHKYAAILAAQETQRVIRDQELKKVMNPVSYWLCSMNMRKNFNDPESRLRSSNAQANAICDDYERRLIDVVESYGLDPDTFNELSAFIMGDKDLRKQIVLQAFYYKLAADLEHNVGGSLSGRPKPKKSSALSSYKQPSVSVVEEGKATTSTRRLTRDELRDQTRRFCLALREVESSRLEMRSDLLTQLGINHFPKNMCDPEVLPALAPSIQNACSSFPRTANKIMNKHGLDQGEFNKLLDKSKSNLIYRMKVMSSLRQLSKDDARSKE